MSKNWEKEFDRLFQLIEWDKKHPNPFGYGNPDEETLKSFIRHLLKSETKKIIQEFIESKRCLHCGKLKENWQGDLSSWCDRCLEEE